MDKELIESVEPIHERSYIYDLHYHLMWVTKYRFNAFTDTEIINQLKNKLYAIATANEITIEAIEVMPNHIYLLISSKPKLSITTIVKNFKGITGKWLFDTFPIMSKYFRHGHIWSKSYYVGSVGYINKNTIENYIETQKERPFK